MKLEELLAPCPKCGSKDKMMIWKKMKRKNC